MHTFFAWLRKLLNIFQATAPIFASVINQCSRIIRQKLIPSYCVWYKMSNSVQRLWDKLSNHIYWINMILRNNSITQQPYIYGFKCVFEHRWKLSYFKWQMLFSVKTLFWLLFILKFANKVFKYTNVSTFDNWIVLFAGFTLINITISFTCTKFLRWKPSLICLDRYILQCNPFLLVSHTSSDSWNKNKPFMTSTSIKLHWLFWWPVLEMYCHKGQRYIPYISNSGRMRVRVNFRGAP